MDLILFAIDFILHVDVHLKELFEHYGVWVYAILFLIIFCETGLVVTPFLPGDSLLFAAGALTVGSVLDVHTLAGVLIIAAVLGYSAIRIRRSSVATIWSRPTPSMPSMAARPSSSPVSCP